MLSYGYDDKGTAVHRLHPWCKVAWVASILLVALLLNNPLYLLLLFLSTLPLILAAKVWKEWVSLTKFLLLLCALVIVVNGLVGNQGSHVLYQLPVVLPVAGAPKITWEAILCGVGNSLRLLAIFSAFSILVFTVHPDDLMLALLKVKWPYKSVLITSLSTKFVPGLIDDAQRIADVQRCRGRQFDKGGRIHRARNYMAVAIPLLSNALDRAIQVAEAMESRAFGSGKDRTFYKELSMRRVDVAALGLAFSPAAFGIALRCLGRGGYEYYPVYQSIGFALSDVVTLIALAFLLNTLFFLARLEERMGLD